MKNVTTSADELQTLLQISVDLSGASPDSQCMDAALSKLHAIIPFTRCALLHQRVPPDLTSAFVYECDGGIPKASIDLSHESEAPLSIRSYLSSFHPLKTLEAAFFWCRKSASESPDRSAAAFVERALLSEGVAATADCVGGRATGNVTLIQLQYEVRQFAIKHMVFASFVASCVHSYFMQDTSRFRRNPDSDQLLREAHDSASWERSCELTLKEKAVLQWIVEGKTSREVGMILRTSERTVKFHLRNIYSKLNVVNRAQAATRASKLRLL